MRKIALLGKILVQNPVQFQRRIEVVPERLFDHDPRVIAASRLGQVLGDHSKQARRNRQIMQRLFGFAQLLAHLGESGGVAIIAVHIVQQTGQFVERVLVDAAMMLQAVLGAGLELIQTSSPIWRRR